MSRSLAERETGTAPQGDSRSAAVLSASERRYRRLFEAARDGIMIVDPATRRIVAVNTFLVLLLGHSTEEFVGRELFEFGLPENGAASQAAFRELQATGTLRCEHLPLLTRHGRQVEVEIVANLYQEGSRPVIQCNIRDITARKRSEAARRQAAEQGAAETAALDALARHRSAELHEANAQVDTFAYSIAHDLRAPLRAMQGFAQLLAQDHRTLLDEAGLARADFINAAAQRMDRSLADLLLFGDSLRQGLELTPVPLEEVVRRALAGCAGEIQARQARVETVPPWPTVLAHEPTLREVLVNLIGSSVSLVADKPPEVRMCAEERPDGIVRIWVEDNGDSAVPAFQRRIVQVFHRLRSTASAGTGLGLAIVRQGIERMGGQMGLVSVTDKGGRFWIELFQAAPAA